MTTYREGIFLFLWFDINLEVFLLPPLPPLKKKNMDLEGDFFTDFGIVFDGPHLSSEVPQLVLVPKDVSLIHRKPVHNMVSRQLLLLGQVLETMLGGQREHSWEQVLSFLTLQSFGKRMLHKDAVDVSKLSTLEQEIFFRIQQQLQDPCRRKRVLDFISNKHITKRLINYFVVHYILNHPVCYFLDQRQYPYSILRPFNEPHQPQTLELIGRGENIRWINLHQEYKRCKARNGYRNCHAAYGRSNAVRGDDDQIYSLCEMNFYLWLDEVGGFEAFYEYEESVRKEKHQYDEDSRSRDRDDRAKGTKRKKKKVMLRSTPGDNYHTTVLTYTDRRGPFNTYHESHQPMLPSVCGYRPKKVRKK
jgi:hypothetical protein